MIDLYLRFDDEAAWAALGIEPDELLAIDVVGVIRKPIQQWTDDGEQVTRRVRGWHVNIRCLDDDRDLSVLDAFTIEPDSPSRVWF